MNTELLMVLIWLGGFFAGTIATVGLLFLCHICMRADERAAAEMEIGQ